MSLRGASSSTLRRPRPSPRRTARPPVEQGSGANSPEGADGGGRRRREAHKDSRGDGKTRKRERAATATTGAQAARRRSNARRKVVKVGGDRSGPGKVRSSHARTAKESPNAERQQARPNVHGALPATSGAGTTVVPLRTPSQWLTTSDPGVALPNRVTRAQTRASWACGSTWRHPVELEEGGARRGEASPPPSLWPHELPRGPLRRREWWWRRRLGFARVALESNAGDGRPKAS